MDQQSDRFRWHPGIVGPDKEVSALITLVQSFNDTGRVQARVRDAIFTELPHHELGEFDIDFLLDHRDSRQPIIFDTDHFEGYERPRLVLHEVTDQLGQAFLVLDGPEPALGWETLVSSLTNLVDSMGIRLTVITDSIPVPTPHTRPAMVTRWASRPELILGSTSPFGRVQVPASFPVVLGQRLGETNHAVIGLASHVPHYLADLDYPESARALVEALRGATGLALPINALAMAAKTMVLRSSRPCSMPLRSSTTRELPSASSAPPRSRSLTPRTLVPRSRTSCVPSTTGTTTGTIPAVTTILPVRGVATTVTPTTTPLITVPVAEAIRTDKGIVCTQS